MSILYSYFVNSIPPFEQVANLKRKFRAEISLEGPGRSSTCEFLQTIREKEGSFLRYKLDEKKVLERALWAYPDQVDSAVKYGSMIVFDTTFSTNE